MASPQSCFRGWQNTSHVVLVLVSVLLLSSARLSAAGRSLLELYKPPPSALLTYHNGAVLQGRIPVSLVWYGRFTPAQKAVVTDFLQSLTTAAPTTPSPSVSEWWNTINQMYLSKARSSSNGGSAQVALAGQTTDEGCSLGKRLTLAQLPKLAARAGTKKGGIALVLTAQDVTVDGFCMSRCGLHGSDARAGTAYIWVGNSATQCPGQCAWPFHQPLYGPQTPALVPPSGDVGMDGMVINIASMVAGTVTNRSATGSTRARRTHRWRPPLPAQGFMAAAPTPVSPATWRWTARRGRVTMPMARMGGSTCFLLCSTLQPLRVRLWCSG